ncbi:hypothetical protein JCGZ_23029 [Jatropha curcas]|uniref:Uncharacterized protein n=1 Tax=Jatropha curcas TaxID=180498 RepID=A0A067L5T5_JATCU|nr:uncharacterized protein LOC105628508 [Jatropha curcas]KDP43821.1 hypothetical protein JCGZ_23029 [Jatropha curcas]
MSTKGEPKVHHCGIAILDPNDNSGGNPGGSYNAMATKGQQSNSQQWISRNSIVDKQTGSYAKTTVKQSYSSGDVFKERSTGRVGHKDELKTTSTFKVGDKSGYYEYQVEERFRKVDYGNSSSSNKKYLK